MFVNGDVTGLEVVGCGWLSEDKVLRNEILNEEDIHSNNEKQFKLPDRLTAKKYMFRMIYGGSEYSYAVDPDFSWISNKPKYWKQVIDNFYTKYNGIFDWHRRLVSDVQRNAGILKTKYGRTYYLPPEIGYNSGTKWPITQIKNYPVQGLGADLVAIARVKIYKCIRQRNLQSKLCLSVHDSVVIDCPKRELGLVAQIIKDSISNVPKNFTRIFGVEFDLPLKAKITVGRNLGELTELS